MAVNDQNNLPPVPNMEELAKSPYGNLELTKYLYESGLQNIFNTYQQNIASLDQSKQQELQDAYMVREMSQKYLGEYASNVGVSDVSGNLLDIYGQYQSNLSDIERNYGELQLGLEQQYLQQRQSSYNDMLLNQFNIEAAKLNEQERGILYNIEMGQIPEGKTDQEYLDEQFEAGTITEQTYQDASRMIMEMGASQEERELWGRLTRGELSKEDLTSEYEAGNLSVEAYNSFFSAIESEEAQANAQSVELDMVRGNTGGLTNEQYLDQKLESGEIDQTTYNALLTQYVVSEELETQALEEQQETARQRTEAISNFTFGNIPGGMSPEEYLQDMFDQGLIGEQEYLELTLQAGNTAMMEQIQNVANDAITRGGNYEEYIMQQVSLGAITEQQAEQALAAVQGQAQQEFLEKFNSPSGLFGYDEEGNLIMSQAGLLDEYRDKVGEDFYNAYADRLSEMTARESMAMGVKIPNTYGDLGAILGDPSFTSQSEVLSIGDNKYAISEQSVMFDETVLDPPTYEDLAGSAGVNELSANRIYSYRGQDYIMSDGDIYKVAQIDENTLGNLEQFESPISIEEQQQWVVGNRGTTEGSNFSFSADTDEGNWLLDNPESFTYKGVNYVRGEDSITGSSKDNLQKEFEKIHGDLLSKEVYVIMASDGRFYVRNENNRYFPLVRGTNE